MLRTCVKLPTYFPWYLDEVAFADCSEDLVNGAVGRQGTVEDVELTFQTLWDIVTTPSWMNHGCHHLDVHNVCELTGFLQVVETLPFDHLSCNLIGDLQKVEGHNILVPGGCSAILF